MADGDGSRGHEDLPDVRGEPEPDWVEGIRRGREERAERLRSLLGGPPTGDAVDGDQDPVRDQTADAQDPPPGTPDPPAGTPDPPAGTPDPPAGTPDPPAGTPGPPA